MTNLLVPHSYNSDASQDQIGNSPGLSGRPMFRMETGLVSASMSCWEKDVSLYIVVANNVRVT